MVDQIHDIKVTAALALLDKIARKRNGQMRYASAADQ